jgi:hypothetical protein
MRPYDREATSECRKIVESQRINLEDILNNHEFVHDLLCLLVRFVRVSDVVTAIEALSNCDLGDAGAGWSGGSGMGGAGGIGVGG